MADSYIKILKEANGDITYPQTLASAVHTNNGSDVETEMGKYVTAEEIASTSALTPPVQTNMIADGAVTTAKIADESVTAAKLVGGDTSATLANGALVEVIGTTSGNSANYAWKYADGRLICFQTYSLSGNCTTAWGNCYSGVQMTPKNYAVVFAQIPVVIAQLNVTNASGNCWLAQANEKGAATTEHPCGYQLVRPNSMSNLSTQMSVVAYGFWK